MQPSVDVLISDIPADLVIRRGRAFYPFDIGFNAGLLGISLIQSGRLVASIEVVVDPDRAKLTREDYAELLGDIARSTLSLYRLGGLSIPAPSSASGARSALVTLDLVRAGFDDLERAVRRVADHPSRRLASTTRRVDVMRARRVDDRALTHAMRSRDGRPATVAEAKARPRLVAAMSGHWIPSILERHREDEVNVYENRAALGFLVWLETTLGGVHRRLEAGTMDLAPPLVAVWMERIKDWRRRIGLLRRREIFRDIAADPILRSTSVFRLQPDYARLFSVMARMRSGLGVGAEATPLVPLERTFELYEIWCYIRLLLAVGDSLPSARKPIANLLKGVDAPHKLGFSLSSGTASTLSLGPGLSLTYQRRFTPTPDASGCRTALVEARPDVVISRDDPSGKCVGIVILDPKYRRGSSLLDGIRDLHVYRDAIRGAKGTGLTRAAAALSPRPFFFQEDDVWNGTPAPGVLTVRPGFDPDVFRRMLSNALLKLDDSPLG